ncbi:MAG: sugar porter family MFS transporter [Burkholderiales bacterium]|nr:sugar porter family MFS transporter [Burkholderiales bacterium]
MTKINPYLLITVCISATCGLLFGFDTSIIAGASPFIQTEFNASNFQLEMVVSSCVLGALFGALLSGKLSDNLGRKKVLIITGLIFILGTIIAALAHSIEHLICGRFILGFAVGMGSFATPMFIAEIAPAQSRGKLVLWNGAFLTGGQVLAFLVNYSLTESGNWRLMIFSGIIPAFILTIGMLFMPESPKWLLIKGKEFLALNILERIRGSKTMATQELALIKTTLNISQAKFSELFSKTLRPVLFIGLLLGIFQQFMGINTVMYYGPHIMKQIGFSDATTQMFGTLGLGITNFIFTVITLLFIDKLGRRKFLLIGSMIAALSLFTMVFLLSNTISGATAYLALFCLITYIIGYCISVGSLFWLMISEIFPLHARGTCMSFVVAVQWGANFLVAASFLTILHALGIAATFSMYGTIALIVFIYVYLKVPETKGVSLELIEQNIQKSLPTRLLGQKSA